MRYDSPLYAHPALETSAGQAWPGLRVERYHLPAMTLPAHYHQHHLLLLHQAAQPVTSRRRQGSRVDEAVFSAGDLGLYPGGEYGAVTWNGPTETIHLYLDDEHLDTLARRDLELSGFALREQFRFTDPLLLPLGQQLLAAVGARHALGLLYVESLTTSLCYHLLTQHARCERRLVGSPHLPSHVLARIESYLEAHVDGAVTLAALAELAHLSVFHFARRFKLTTGQSPYQYVLGWKIRRAQQLLRAKGAPLAAISAALGFATPTHFTATFKRLTGLTPQAYQQQHRGDR